MKHLTVNELKRFCEIQIKNGNGDKKILISNDDEGNGFHELWYQFTELDDDMRQVLKDTCSRYDENCIILG